MNMLRWNYLLTHGDRNAAITCLAAHDAVHSPSPRDGYERGVQAAICLKVDVVHLQGDEGRGIASAMDVGLVAWDVGVIYNRRVRDDSIHHWSIGQVGPWRPLHGQRRLGRGHRPVLAEVEPLREANPIIHRFDEFLNRHGVKSNESISCFPPRNQYR